MFRGTPSLLALLGLAAAAGLQNRSRMTAMQDNADPDQGRSPGPWSGSTFGSGEFGGGFGGVFPGGMGGGFVFNLSDLFGGRSHGAVVSGGLGDLLQQFETAGQSQKAQSWVSNGPNQLVGAGELEQVLSEDLLSDLEQRTGLPRAELLQRLANGLPETVNRLTPQGRVPTETEAEHFILGPDVVELKEPGSGR